ncbi:MAG: hypothetical protein HXX14_09895 [Bacteroidetes bacterium]|nr:hypothetical protein [Bacteroidota bacterium]
MENIFSFKRFWLLVRKHANDNWKIFLISLILISATSLVTAGFDKYARMDQFYTIYLFILVLVGAIYTGSFFKNWTNSARVISLISLPASVFEKIAVIIFYTVILLIPIFTTVFYGSYFLISSESVNGSLPLSALSLKQSPLLSILLPFAFFQSLFLLIYIWFQKRQFLITLLVIITSIFIAYFLNRYYIQWLTGNTRVGIYPFELFHSRVEYHKIRNGCEITSDLIANMNILIYSIMTILFYIASYFKLKEKEI